MQSITIEKNQAGQRADKFLCKYLPGAQKSLLYKMMRKKNITLNGKKMTGNEILNVQDELQVFFSDDTFRKFRGSMIEHPFPFLERISVEERRKFQKWIIYEDEHLIFMNKPAGILSQQANGQDLSINEYMIAYLLEQEAVKAECKNGLRPSVCNRLDRNTTGLITGGKTLQGLQELSRIFRERSVHKFYIALVDGVMLTGATMEGYLKKDTEKNKVTIYKNSVPDSDYICTEYLPLGHQNHKTLVKIKLITGKPHQIRAHLASIGHPILGDAKYGHSKINHLLFQQYGVKYQLLHAYCLDFSDYECGIPSFSYLMGKCWYAPPNQEFQKVLTGEGLYGYLE